jgi:SAM-dependent methyltransferase
MPKKIAPRKPGLSEKETDIFFGIINRFIGYFTLESQKESQNDESREYPFVPMDTRQVFRQIQLARQHLLSREEGPQNYSFLDIGCGIGNIMLVAEQMELDVFGFEKDPFPCAIAKKLFGEEKVLQEDIWEYSDYERFDIIYYFRPFHDGTVQRKFEHYIEDQLKPGGILIANRKMSLKIETDPRFRRLSPKLPVWEKGN